MWLGSKTNSTHVSRSGHVSRSRFDDGNYDQLLTNNKQDNPFQKLQIMANISSL